MRKNTGWKSTFEMDLRTSEASYKILSQKLVPPSQTTEAQASIFFFYCEAENIILQGTLLWDLQWKRKEKNWKWVIYGSFKASQGVGWLIKAACNSRALPAVVFISTA